MLGSIYAMLQIKGGGENGACGQLDQPAHVDGSSKNGGSAKALANITIVSVSSI